MVLFVVVKITIDTHDDGNVFALGRRRYDDLLCTGFKVFFRAVAVFKCAGGVDDDVHLVFFPRNVFGIPFVGNNNVFAVDVKALVRYLDGAGVVAVNGVVAEQMGHKLPVPTGI